MSSQPISGRVGPAKAKIGDKTYLSPAEQARGINKLMTSSSEFRGLMNTVKKYQENQGNGLFLDPERYANSVILGHEKLAPKLKQLGVTAGVQLVAFARDSMSEPGESSWIHRNRK
jgi:hypothetical protein